MLKIGVLGAGHPNEIHLRILLEMDNVQVLGFYDSNTTLAPRLAAELGIPAFESSEALIEASDAVIIAAPTLAHYELAEKAIRQSKHIFIEKPLAQTLSQAKSMMRLASEANIKVQVGHAERFNPAFVAARGHLENPLFIEAQRLSKYEPGKELSVVHDLMMHDLDIVLSLVKANIRRISASGFAVMGATPDIANARIEFDNGAVASLTASRIAPENKRQATFFGNEAYVNVDFLEKTAGITWRNQGMEGISAASLKVNTGDHKDLDYTDLNSIEIPGSRAVRAELESFIACIEANSRPLVSIEDGFKAMELANKILDQVRLNANFAVAAQ